MLCERSFFGCSSPKEIIAISTFHPVPLVRNEVSELGKSQVRFRLIIDF
jgi:hypothetical protein